MQTFINASGQPIAVAGQVVDNGLNDIVSRFNGEATANIAFGIGVKPGTNDHEVKMTAGGSDAFEGVVVYGYNHQPGANGDLDQTAGTGGLKPKAGLQIIRRGRVWVQIDASISTIVANVDRPFWRYATNGGNTVIGAFSNVTDGGKNQDVTKLGIFTSGIRTAADGTKIAELDLSIVNKP